MILLVLLAVPLLGAVLCAGWRSKASYISAIAIGCVFTLTLYAYFLGESQSGLEDFWLLEYKKGWFYLGLDGLSFILLLVAEILSTLALILSFDKPKHQFFLLSVLTGLIGLLLSVDLLAFFIFWEWVLIPLYFWILIAGKERKIFVSLQFLIFTQASGLILLASIVALFSYTKTLDINQLGLITLPASVEFWIASGLTLAFLIKLPAFPFHVWMVGIFRESPIAALMSGFLLETGAYGILRFVLPLFPKSALILTPMILCWGIIGVIYGAVLAFSQKNPRKILAYSTLSHASLMLVGLLSDNSLALSGVAVLIVTHALSTAGLLIALETHMGLSLLFVMATLGLPGLGNFVGELLLLFGLFQQHPWVAVAGSLSLVLGAAYWLRLLVMLYYGNSFRNQLQKVRIWACSVLAILLLWIGLFPGHLLDLVAPSWKSDTVIEDGDAQGDAL